MALCSADLSQQQLNILMSRVGRPVDKASDRRDRKNWGNWPAAVYLIAPASHEPSTLVYCGYESINHSYIENSEMQSPKMHAVIIEHRSWFSTQHALMYRRLF